MLLLLMLLGEAPVFAQSSPDAPTSASAPKTPEEQLEEAVYQYQTLGSTTAIITLLNIAEDPRAPTSVRHEAIIYLGEVYLFDESRDEAERRALAAEQFTIVIQADPAFEIDNFRHPPEVGVFYAELRRRIIPTLKPPAAPPSIFLPALYYKWGEWPAYEGLLTGTEMAFAAGATGLNVYLLVNRTTFFEDEAERAARLRAAQLSCFTGYVGMHLWRTLRARRHHQETWRAELLLGQASLGEPPVMLSVQARF